MTSKVDALSQTTSYQYDDLGRSKKRTDARGWVTNYSYTMAGQTLTTDYTDAVTTDVTYTYDRAGRAQYVADAAGTRSFVYYDTGTDPNQDADLLNKSARLQSETLPAYFGSHVINFGYQYSVANRANGALASLKIDSGSLYTVGYGFDAVGRLGTLTYNTATPFTYAYVANSNLVDTVAQSTTGYKRDYDYEPASNRMNALKNQFGSVSASTVENRLTYDFLGRRNTEKIAGSNWMTALGRGTEAGVHADYQYSDRSELMDSAKYQLAANWNVGGIRATTVREYVYDPLGNRTADNIGGVAGAYSPNALNQYASAPGAGTMGYDANGNLTSDGTRTYDYDGENRLIKITQGGSIWNYAYDYMGRRIRKWGTGLTEQRFLYDGWNLIAETDSAGTLTRRYAWGFDVSGSLQGAGGVGGLLLIQDGSNTYYPLYDASHNVIGLYNGSGGIDSAYEYDPFGRAQTATGSYSAANPFRFSTKYTDSTLEGGLVYYGHRYYSSTLGRFINRDPVEEAGGINLYAFCGNDGINSYDFLGMSTRSTWSWDFGGGHWEETKTGPKGDEKPEEPPPQPKEQPKDEKPKDGDPVKLDPVTVGGIWTAGDQAIFDYNKDRVLKELNDEDPKSGDIANEGASSESSSSSTNGNSKGWIVGPAIRSDYEHNTFITDGKKGLIVWFSPIQLKGMQAALKSADAFRIWREGVRIHETRHIRQALRAGVEGLDTAPAGHVLYMPVGAKGKLEYEAYDQQLIYLQAQFHKMREEIVNQPGQPRNDDLQTLREIFELSNQTQKNRDSYKP